MPSEPKHFASPSQQLLRSPTGRRSSAGRARTEDHDLARVASLGKHAGGATGEGDSRRPGSRGIRARRVLSAGVAVIAGSILLLFVPIIVYAFVGAFRARGLPDQTAINHFAATVSPMLMPWLERVLTPVLAVWAVRRTEQARAVDGLAVGILAGVLGLGVTLAFGGSLTVGSMISFLVLAGLGWLGGLLGQRMSSQP